MTCRNNKPQSSQTTIKCIFHTSNKTTRRKLSQSWARKTFYLNSSSMQGFNHFFELPRSTNSSHTATSITTHRSKEIYRRVTPCVDLRKRTTGSFSVFNLQIKAQRTMAKQHNHPPLN